MKTIALLILLISCSQLPSPVAVDHTSGTESSTFKIIHPRLCATEAVLIRLASVVEPLNKDGYRIMTVQEQLTPLGLKECEILLISAATQAQTDLLHAWVSEGGSLLILSSAPTLLREKFGIREGIAGSKTVRLSLRSPIVQGRSEAERLKVAPTSAEKVFLGPGHADLFLRMSGSETEASALALKLGRGRVAAFGDAAVFTSKQDLPLAFNVFHWLSHVL